MKTFVSPYLKLSLLVPEEWYIEEEEGMLSIYDPVNGKGALQLSSYEVDGEVPLDLKETLKDHLSGSADDLEIEESKGVAYCNFIDSESTEWRYWLFFSGATLVFASYNCSSEDKGVEDQIVNKIIESARL